MKKIHYNLFVFLSFDSLKFNASFNLIRQSFELKTIKLQLDKYAHTHKPPIENHRNNQNCNPNPEMQIYLVQRCILHSRLYIKFHHVYNSNVLIFQYNLNWQWWKNSHGSSGLNMLVLSHKSQALLISRRDYCQSVIILWTRLMDMANIRQFNEFIWQFTFTRQLTNCHHVQCMSTASDHIASYRISS